MSGKYDAIIDMEKPISKRHTPMARLDRAAQFSPFAALVGYDAAIRESGRRTEAKRVLDEDMRGILDLKIQDAQREEKVVCIEHFVPDGRKDGGRYVKSEGHILRMDAIMGTLTMDDGTTIALDAIWDII